MIDDFSQRTSVRSPHFYYQQHQFHHHQNRRHHWQEHKQQEFAVLLPMQ